MRKSNIIGIKHGSRHKVNSSYRYFLLLHFIAMDEIEKSA